MGVDDEDLKPRWMMVKTQRTECIDIGIHVLFSI